MTHDDMIHILRNPHGSSEERVREARLQAADVIESRDKTLYHIYNELRTLRQEIIAEVTPKEEV